jgi:hypothetical protein
MSVGPRDGGDAGADPPVSGRGSARVAMVGERGDVFDLAGGDDLAAGSKLIQHALGVDGVPGDDRVHDDREAERLLGLPVVMEQERTLSPPGCRIQA